VFSLLQASFQLCVNSVLPLSQQRIEFSQRRLDFTPGLVSQRRYVPALCVVIHPGLQLLGLCNDGFFSLTKELGAGDAFG
jgi:hypothetical protein